MAKDDGAFLTIGELAKHLGVAQHILRYWETRFPQLRPLQRSGNRRYYRPRDVDIARQINQLLNDQGFTVRGAQRVLAGGKAQGSEGIEEARAPLSPGAPAEPMAAGVQSGVPINDSASPTAPGNATHQLVGQSDLALLIARLTVIRQNLVEALEPN